MGKNKKKCMTYCVSFRPQCNYQKRFLGIEKTVLNRLFGNPDILLMSHDGLIDKIFVKLTKYEETLWCTVNESDIDPYIFMKK